MSDYKFVNNSKEILEKSKIAKRRGLEAIGVTAEGHAKENTPVITGRLRNSISYAVEDDDVYIGSNVEYAPFVELGARGRKPVHMLRNAATNHADEYKNILQESFENA